MENRKGFNGEKMALGRNFTASPAWLRFSPLRVARIAAQWLPSCTVRQATGQPSGAQPARRH
jgi:hypothetical protein